MRRRDGECVIVGGGVIGLALARELALRGRAVRVLDRGDVAGASTPAAAGMLAPVSEAEVEDRECLALAQDSLARYPEFVARLEREAGQSCEYRTDGTLWIALDRDDAGELDHLQDTLTVKISGRPARRLEAAEVLEREPRLSGRVLFGLLVEGDLQLDPRALHRALERAAVRAGVEIERGVRVREVVVRGVRVAGLIETAPDGARRERACDTAVIAAGAWSTETIRSPLSRAGVRPVKGQILRLRGERLLRHVVRHPDVYLVPRDDGELLVGSTMEEMGFDAAPTAGVVHDLLRRAVRVLPGLYDLEVAELSVGFRPVSRDNRPALGPCEVEGLYAATGHGRQGVLMAPATAHYLAECIVGGRTPEALGPFLPARFEGAPTAAAGRGTS